MSAPLRQIVCLLLFVAGLCSTVAVSHAVVPSDSITDIEIKEAWLQLAEEAPDVLFCGSSLTFRSVIPEVFEAHCREAGVEMTSRNHGVAGLTAPGVDLMVRDALGMQPDVRVVVIELRWWMVGLKEVDRMTYRSIRRHTWHGTQLALDALRHFGVKPAEEEEMRAVHLRHFVHRVFRPGRWLEWWRQLGRGPEDYVVHPTNQRGGYRVPRAEDSKSLARRRAAFDAEKHDRFVTKSWARLSRRLLDGDPEFLTRQDWTDADALAQLQSDVEACGVLPVFVMYPVSTPRPLILRDVRDAGLRHVLDFNRPDLYPELFESGNRFDRGHLNERGARRLTELLAQALLEVLAAADLPSSIGKPR